MATQCSCARWGECIHKGRVQDRQEWARRCAKQPGREWVFRTRSETGTPIENAAEGALFDELVVDHWLHIEQMEERAWRMRVGDARISVSVESDGLVRVDVERGAYDEVLGVTTEQASE